MQTDCVLCDGGTKYLRIWNMKFLLQTWTAYIFLFLSHIESVFAVQATFPFCQFENVSNCHRHKCLMYKTAWISVTLSVSFDSLFLFSVLSPALRCFRPNCGFKNVCIFNHVDQNLVLSYPNIYWHLRRNTSPSSNVMQLAFGLLTDICKRLNLSQCPSLNL